jgi:hypothetical protein
MYESVKEVTSLSVDSLADSFHNWIDVDFYLR